MVQQGGQDDVRVNIIIETFLRNIQGIAVAKTELESLTQKLVKGRTAAGTFTGEMEKKFDPSMAKAGQSLSKLLEGFSPRFIGSIQGVNQAFVATGKTLKEFTTLGLQTEAISPQIANGLNAISQTMVAVGVTGRVSVQVIQQLREQLSSLKPVTDADTAAIAALNTQLNTLGTQTTVAAEQALARTTRQLTTTQKAGQGMLLSFALTQAASGKLSQAMFGLGFAVIFTGTQFLNLTTVLTAVGLALASIALDKFQNRLSAADKITESVTKRTERYTNALTVMKGEAKLTGEALADMAIQGEDISGVLEANIKALEEYQQNQRSTLAQIGKDASDFWSSLKKSFTEPRFESMLGGESPVEKLLSGWMEDLDETGKALQEKTKQTAQDIMDEFALEEEKEIRLNILLAPVVKERNVIAREMYVITSTITSAYDTINEYIAERTEQRIDIIEDGVRAETKAIQRAGREQTTAISDALQDQITVRRKALNEELDIIRDSAEEKVNVIRDALDKEQDAIRDAAEEKIDIVRDRLDEEIDAIKNTSEEKIDVIKDGLKEEIDAIRDALNDRIDVIKDKADDEIDAQRDKIDVLKDKERELATVLNDLQSEREQIRASIYGAEAELAALEREAALAGVGATEEQAIIKARIDGLRAEGSAIDQTIKDKERERGGIQQQIETIEELIEAIEDARDEAIEAAKDQADAQVEAAEDAAEDIIKEIEKQTEATIKAAEKAADAQIEAAQDARDEAIDAANERAEVEIDDINEVKDDAITAARERASEEITEAQRSTRERITAVNDYTTEAVEDAQERGEADVKAEKDRGEAAEEWYGKAKTAADTFFGAIEQWRLYILRLEEDEITKAEELSDKLKDEILPAVREILRIKIIQGSLKIAEHIEDPVLREYIRKQWIKNILTEMGIPANIIKGWGYQLGTRAVPGAMGQPQLAVVHGGEAITPPGALSPPSEKALARIIYMTINVRNEADITRIKRIVNADMGHSINTTVRRGVKTFGSRRVSRPFGDR